MLQALFSHGEMSAVDRMGKQVEWDQGFMALELTVEACLLSFVSCFSNSVLKLLDRFRGHVP